MFGPLQRLSVQTAQSAALCVFDLRVGVDMVQRYNVAHRSLYPSMRTVRGHFVMTSHVGAPLNVWDSR
jgi:hypothetical protein